ncbi:hypothetical protein QEH59_01215 [Coraliomargarita sp. SDUM461004]|uniref:Uncharacterized protein n=1 Tax=Thalassobacterium sedimentorum TaxID=3041258 RepID=A0ABU1AE41_9BACT|nr:hypothetical protein [Coraliomargarita sp. SDUM461004]MDQ8193025.1 hypothetical protein [Coraliomargarita sp. SDUM461004]
MSVPRSCDGFALVIALSMMAFVLLLLLALTTFTQTQVATSNVGITKLRAEQSALLSLNLALGHLQKMTGSDQRVTSRADILDGGYANLVPAEAKKYWTGVWRSDDANPLNPNSKTFIGWLASMPTENNELSSITSNLLDPYELVSAGTDSSGAFVPAVEAETITRVDDNLAYAWAVLDEGVKAKVNARSWEEDTDVYESTDSLSQSLRFGAAESAKAEVLTGLSDFRSLMTVGERSQMSNLIDLELRFGTEIWAPYQHDLTVQSYGVLADVKNGGLRRDLSRGLSDQLSELSNQNITDVFPMKWDSLAAWSNIYKLLDNPNADMPVLKPRNTLPVSWDGARAEFDADLLSTEPLIDGAISDWKLVSHPIAPVVQQFIWRVGGVISDYSDSQIGNRWDWRDDRPDDSPSVKERWAEILQGRHVISPLVVLWNPYNVALDTSDYRITYDPAADMQIVVRDGATGATQGLFGTPTNIVDLWQDHDSTTRTGHFTFSLFSDYDWRDITNLNQTVLQPGEMKIFAIQFTPATSQGYKNYNGAAGGFGGWVDGRPLPTQMIGPVGGAPHNTFRAVISSQDFDVTDTNSEWIHDSLDLDFGENTSMTDINDFRLTLAITDAKYTSGEPNEGFVVRDVWGLRPPASESGSYPFTDLWAGTDETSSGSEDFTLWDYYHVVSSSNIQLGSSAADILYAANIVARLKTSSAELGADSIPYIAHYNPLAWHARPGHSSEVHSPLWDVSVFDRAEWNSDKAMIDSINSGIARAGNSVSFAGQEHVVLKELPRQPLNSIGQLMHAEVGALDTVPLYTIGSSYAPPFGALTETIYTGSGNVDGNGTALEAIDLAWHYNDALFDSWFFSTVPEAGQALMYPPFETFDTEYVSQGKKLPNSRYKYYSRHDVIDDDYMSELRDIDTAAATLMVDGPFNVNSTSVEAWKAVLATLLQANEFRYFDIFANGIRSLTAAELEVPVSRFQHPMASNSGADVETNSEAWAGFRSLNSDELTDLAEEIVRQVKMRGPFRSLSDFINRRLVDNETGRAGALQAALDMTVNTVADFGGEPTETEVWGDSVDWDKHAPASGAGAPGWILQNDLLQSLAPSLSARSDTFRIRAYGASLNPLTRDVERAAVCEAVVQRVPTWVDSTDDPEINSAIPDNQRFGRQYVIVSFRWLSEDEI